MINTKPVFNPVANPVLDELTPLSLTVTAVDVDTPAQGITYSKVSGPAALSVNPDSDGVSWTPTEAEGPGTFAVTLRATDSGPGSLSDEVSFSITVNEVNVAPTLVLPAVGTVAELIAWTLDPTSITDPDLPVNALAYSLVSGPAGVSVDANSGRIAWEPTEAQGPGVFPITVRVTDTNPDAPNQQNLFDEATLSVTVNEVNLAPTLTYAASATIDEMVAWTIDPTSTTDPDVPANTFSYSLVSGPAGVTVNSATGRIAWEPAENQGPDTVAITVRVTDTNPDAINASQLTDDFTVNVTVNEVNSAPDLGVLANATIHAAGPFERQLAATDPDLPANGLTYELVSAPAGVQLSPGGLLNWTPATSAAGGTETITARVRDNATSSLSDDASFDLTVVAPLAITSRTIEGGGFKVDWFAIPGAVYRLDYAIELPGINWDSVPGDVTATGASATKTDPTAPTSGNRFYRVRQVTE